MSKSSDSIQMFLEPDGSIKLENGNTWSYDFSRFAAKEGVSINTSTGRRRFQANTPSDVRLRADQANFAIGLNSDGFRFKLNTFDLDISVERLLASKFNEIPEEVRAQGEEAQIAYILDNSPEYQEEPPYGYRLFKKSVWDNRKRGWDGHFASQAIKIF